MDRSRLRRLLADGEKQTVDFKLECHAFQGQLSANAELVKDVIALANNGNRTSYLMVGVNDTGDGFKTPKNGSLTDDNLQDLIRGAVSPVPRAHLSRVQHFEGGQDYQLVVIRVGPNRRRAYSFARDFIDHKARVSFRRHEVWVRRGATSDLATPEEIAALQAGEDLAAQGPVGTVDRVYGRMPIDLRPSAVFDDLASSSEDLEVSAESQLAVVNVRGRNLVLRLLYFEKLGRDTNLHMILQRAWGYEHGLLVLTPGTVPRGFLDPVPLLTPGRILDSKEVFGTLAQVPLPGSDPTQLYDFGLLDEMFNKSTRNGPPLAIPALLVTRFRATSDVIKKGKALVAGLNASGLAEHILAQRDAVQETLESVAAIGRLVWDRSRPPAEAVAHNILRAVDSEEPEPNLDPHSHRTRVIEGPEYSKAAASILTIAEGGLGDFDLQTRVLGEELVVKGADRDRDVLQLLQKHDPTGHREVSRLIHAADRPRPPGTT